MIYVTSNAKLVFSLQTEVIVNTVAGDLNLTKNPCSKAIVSEAGDEIKKLCEKWIKDHGQVKDGESAITNGCKLKCKKVLHVSCPTWTADQGEKVTRNWKFRLSKVLTVTTVTLITYLLQSVVNTAISLVCRRDLSSNHPRGAVTALLLIAMKITAAFATNQSEFRIQNMNLFAFLL